MIVNYLFVGCLLWIKLGDGGGSDDASVDVFLLKLIMDTSFLNYHRYFQLIPIYKFYQ